MPARRKFTDAEEAADLTRRSREILQKATRKHVDAILTKFPHAATSCLQHLEANGFTLEAEAMVSPSSKQSTAIALRDQRLKEIRAGPHESLKDFDISQWAPEDLIPTKYCTIGSLSVVLLQTRILSQLSPVVLSMANLRTMTVRGAVESTKTELCRIIEWLTGKHETFALRGRHRVWPLLTAWLKECVEARPGRVAKLLKLPPVWDEIGNFTLTVIRDALVVTHNYLEKTVSVPGDYLPQGVDLSSVYVIANWSEASATVGWKRPDEGCLDTPLVVLFGAFILRGESYCSDAAPRVALGNLAGCEHLALKNDLLAAPPLAPCVSDSSKASSICSMDIVLSKPAESQTSQVTDAADPPPPLASLRDPSRDVISEGLGQAAKLAIDVEAVATASTAADWTPLAKKAKTIVDESLVAPPASIDSCERAD